MHLTRHVMYTHISRALPLPLGGHIFGISGLKYWKGSSHYTPPFCIVGDDAEITEADYPAINMCALPYEENMFDYVISDQVIEHIEGSVEEAIAEAYRVLKSGGILILTSAFIYPVHYGPKDLWRFSPDALQYLCRNFSEIVECGGWGNRWVHILLFLYKNAGNWEVRNNAWNLARMFTLQNDPAYPLSTWIIAKK